MPIRNITPQELGNLLEQQPGMPLIDVRTPREFRGTHVVGATNVPFNRLSAERLEATVGEHKDEAVFFICKAGVRSLKACERALQFGLSDVVNVEGGTDKCVSVGLPIETGCKAISLDRQVRVAAGGLAFVGGVLAIVVHPYWAGLSAFIGAGLVFSGVMDTCTMSDILAKMPWNR